MMNAMRLLDGIPARLFQERTGLPLEEIEDKLISARQRGLLDTQNGHWKPTERGRYFLNDLLEIFLPH